MNRLLLVLGLGFAWNFPGAWAASANTAGQNANANVATNGSSASPGVPRNPALAKIFRKGVEAFDQKRFDEAISAFQQVLSKQADHTPSKIYIARSHYQQKNLLEAQKAFKDVDMKDLEPDAAYDYGQTCYRSGDYSTAIKAFAIVPNGHPLYDLAGYYGGISAYKLGEFQQAMDLLDQAVVLPSKLVRSQKLYRLEAEKKLYQKQKAEVQATKIPGMRGSGKDAIIPTAFVYEPSRAVGIGHRFTNQEWKAKKGKIKRDAIHRSSLDLSWGSEKPAAGVRNQLFYLADVQIATAKANERELLLLPTPSDTLENMTLVRFTPKTLVRSELGVGYETAIGSSSTIGVAGGVYSYGADGSFSKEMLYSPYLSLFLAQKSDTLEMMLSAATHPRFDVDRLLITQTIQDGSIAFNINKNFFFGLKGQLNEYSYNTERLSGPDWNGRGQLEIGYRRGRAVSLTLGTFYEIAQGWRLYDASQELPLVKFNLSQVGGYAQGDLQFTSWWGVGARARFAGNSYNNVLPEQGENFPVSGQSHLDDNFPSAISQIAVYTSLSKNF